MDSVYAKYKKMNVDGSFICLEKTDDVVQYFCYPANAKAIGFEGCIMYCFIEPYSDMVSACNPESCTIENPYDYVKTLQASFDGREIEYSDEYFETYTGGDSDGYKF